MHYSTQLDNGHCRTFLATKEIPKRCTLYMTMATIIGRKRGKEKNFYIKIWCTIYDHHERGLNDENVQMFNV